MGHEKTPAFVCYAHEDQVVIEDIRVLQERGVSLWIDERIDAGSVWRSEIVQALDCAALVLYFVSESSVVSPHCQREISYAMDQDIPIVPVFVEPAEYPNDQRLHLNRVQAVERANLGRDQYLQALETAVSQGRPENADRAQGRNRITSISRPSVVFLPFDHARDSDAIDFLAYSLAEDIANLTSLATGLVRVVAAGDSEPTFSVSGRIRRSSSGLRIDIQLSHRGERLWSSKQDTSTGIEVDERITAEFANDIAHQIWLWIKRKYDQVPAEALDALGTVFRAMEHGYDPHRQIEFASRAIQLAPDLGIAHAILAKAHLHFVSEREGTHAKDALAHANFAIQNDPYDAATLQLASDAIHAVGSLEVALEFRRRIVELVPYGGPRSLVAITLIALGRIDEAVCQVDFDHPRHTMERWVVCAVHLLNHRYEQALRAINRNLAETPDDLVTLAWRMSLLGHLGRIEEATEVLGRIKKLEPGWNIREWGHALRLHWRTDELIDAVVEGWKKVSQNS